MNIPCDMTRKKTNESKPTNGLTDNKTNRLFMGDPGWTVKSSHTDSPKSLTLTFEIPKEQYKGSNTRDNDIMLRRKTSWLRENGEKAWRDAIEKEFGLKAIEPSPSEWNSTGDSLTPSEQTAYDAMLDQQDVVDRLKMKIIGLDTMINQAKSTRKSLKRNDPEYKRLGGILNELTPKRKELNAQLKLESKFLTRTRHAWDKVHERQERRRQSIDRKAYLKAKAKANEARLLFPGPVEVFVQSNIVTGHVFDAPNCWPSVKPLQDGGTDTCVLWHDDNNNWIRKTSFYGGGKDPDCYVIRIMVREFMTDDDPFQQDQEEGEEQD